MPTIEIPDELKIKTIQRVACRSDLKVGERPGMMDIALDAIVKPEEAAVLNYLLNQNWMDVEVELVIRKKG